jgi:hypothetical protein
MKVAVDLLANTYFVVGFRHCEKLPRKTPPRLKFATTVKGTSAGAETMSENSEISDDDVPKTASLKIGSCCRPCQWRKPNCHRGSMPTGSLARMQALPAMAPASTASAGCSPVKAPPAKAFQQDACPRLPERAQ